MNTNFKVIEAISFPSDVNELSKAELLVDKICQTLSVNDDFYGNVLIAVTEAVNNAIKHGNKNDVSKQVQIRVSDAESVFSIEVKDQGLGFDFNNLPDPTAPENLEKENGRGIFLMKSLADKVEFENEGRDVIMTFSKN
jgi:serine/threonine-protein kinase RsbW